MSRFYNFHASAFDTWIDTDEVAFIQSPVKYYEGKYKWLQGSPYWRIKFILKSGVALHMDIWSEDLANNYVKILRGLGNGN